MDLQRRGHDFDCFYILFKRKSFVVDMPLERIIRPNDHNIHYDELAPIIKSVKTHGIFLPIMVRKFVTCYEIVDGKKRYLVALHLGFKTIKADIEP